MISYAEVELELKSGNITNHYIASALMGIYKIKSKKQSAKQIIKAKLKTITDDEVEAVYITANTLFLYDELFTLDSKRLADTDTYLDMMSACERIRLYDRQVWYVFWHYFAMHWPIIKIRQALNITTQDCKHLLDTSVRRYIDAYTQEASRTAVPCTQDITLYSN